MCCDIRTEVKTRKKDVVTAVILSINIRLTITKRFKNSNIFRITGQEIIKASTQKIIYFLQVTMNIVGHIFVSAIHLS